MAAGEQHCEIIAADPRQQVRITATAIIPAPQMIVSEYSSGSLGVSE